MKGAGFADGSDSELRLGLGKKSPSFDTHNTRSGSRFDGVAAKSQHQHLMTIFYNGQICVSDVTEMQARAIISIANRFTDEGKKQKQERQQGLKLESSPIQSTPLVVPSPMALPQSCCNSGLSMKLSLQRFLQKRQTRINASAPYCTKPKSATSTVS